jgi:CRP-like cAMP-binding protein
MHSLLKRYIQTNVAVAPDQLDTIGKAFKPKTVKRNTVLLTAGDVCRDLYFVNKGCIRTYYISQAGKERTRYLAFDGIIGTALSSFITQKPSFEFVDTLEDAELLCISHHHFYQLVDEIPPWADFYRKLLEFAYSYQNKRIENLVTLTAKQRYDEIMKNHPEYIQRLPNHILASYLDMSQETLSRLKSKL